MARPRDFGLIMNNAKSDLSFFRRLSIAVACFFRALGDTGFAAQVGRLSEHPEIPLPKPSELPRVSVPSKPVELPPERLHASGLGLLAMLQREGRLIDFLLEDLAGFPDADIGAAARAVHSGCRKVLAQCLTLAPVLTDSEGAAVVVPTGFDANRIRLTGNIVGAGPFRGILKHHGWATTSVRLPTVSEALDPRVLAPAEIELP